MTTEMATATRGDNAPYFVPASSISPVIINIGVFLMALGFILKINALGGNLFLIAGISFLIYGVLKWVNEMVSESEGGSYHAWEDCSYRIGMGYFIWGELMLFAGFILGLFYLRVLSIPHLASFTDLYPGFSPAWPASGSGPAGESFTAISASGVPTINAVLLVISAALVVWARAGLAKKMRGQIAAGLALTAVVGVAFVVSQFMEYGHAASELGVTSATGVYGSAFYMLTGFHIVHLVIGLIIIAIVLLRNAAQHFVHGHSFILDAIVWYWNFLVVAPGLLIFVYFYWI